MNLNVFLPLFPPQHAEPFLVDLFNDLAVVIA